MTFQMIAALQQSQEFLEPLVAVTYLACPRLFATIKLSAHRQLTLLIAGPSL